MNNTEKTAFYENFDSEEDGQEYDFKTLLLELT
jgi:hypothetical protein